MNNFFISKDFRAKLIDYVFSIVSYILTKFDRDRISILYSCDMYNRLKQLLVWKLLYFIRYLNQTHRFCVNCKTTV